MLTRRQVATLTAAATASMTKAAWTPEVRSAVLGSDPATRDMTAMLVAVPYFLAANYCLTLIEHGGPGWLNLLVLVFCWNALKFLIMGPISLVLLIRARLEESATRRRDRRALRPIEPAEPTTAHMP